MTDTPPLLHPDLPPRSHHLLVLTGALPPKIPTRPHPDPTLRRRLFPDGTRTIKMEGERFETIEIPRVSGIFGGLSQDAALRENLCYSPNNILIFMLGNRFFEENLSVFLGILQISCRALLILEHPTKKNWLEIDQKQLILLKNPNIPAVFEEEFSAAKETLLKTALNRRQNVCSMLDVSLYSEPVQSALRCLKIAIQRDLPSSTIPAEWIAACLLGEALEVQMELNRMFGRNIAKTGETGKIWNEIQEKWKKTGIDRDFVRAEIRSASRRLVSQVLSGEYGKKTYPK